MVLRPLRPIARMAPDKINEFIFYIYIGLYTFISLVSNWDIALCYRLWTHNSKNTGRKDILCVLCIAWHPTEHCDVSEYW